MSLCESETVPVGMFARKHYLIYEKQFIIPVVYYGLFIFQGLNTHLIREK